MSMTEQGQSVSSPDAPGYFQDRGGYWHVRGVEPPRTSHNLRVLPGEEANEELVKWVQAKLNNAGGQIPLSGKWDAKTADEAARVGRHLFAQHERDYGVLTKEFVELLENNGK